jgi:hypothetical protein
MAYLCTIIEAIENGTNNTAETYDIKIRASFFIYFAKIYTRKIISTQSATTQNDRPCTKKYINT